MGSPCNLSTRFEGNVAFTGGAITSLGYKAHTVLMNVDIYNNTALGATPDNVAFVESVTNINYANDIAPTESFLGGCGSGGGGGMCLSCGEVKMEASSKAKCYGSISGTRFRGNTAEFGGGLYVTADGTCEDQDDCYTIPITRNVLTFPSPMTSQTNEGFKRSFYWTVRARLAFLNRYIFIPAFPDNQVAGYYSTDGYNGAAYKLLPMRVYPDYVGYEYNDGIPDDTNTYTEWRNYTEEVDGSATLFTGNEAVGGAGGAIYMEQLATINITCDMLEASYENRMYGGEGNNSGYSGSQLNLTTKYDTLNPCRSWTGNAATFGFGDILGTSPVAMNISFSPKAYQHLTGSGSYLFTSGDDLHIQISLMDLWGRQYFPIVTSTKSAMSLTISAQAFEYTLKRSLQENTQKGTATTFMNLLVGTSKYIPDDLPIFSFLATPGLHMVTVTTAPSALGRYFPPYVFNVSVRPCKLGEYDPVWDQGPQCVPCDVGSYRIDEDMKECKVCPEDATCVKDTSLQPNADNPIIVPDDGYFHSNPFSTQIYQCDEQAVLNPCAYPGRHDRIVEFQLTLLNDPYKYNETQYYMVLCAPGYSGIATQQVSKSIVEGIEDEHGEDRSIVKEEDASSEQSTPPLPALKTPSMERAQSIEPHRNGAQEAPTNGATKIAPAGEDSRNVEEEASSEQSTAPQPACKNQSLERAHYIGTRRDEGQEADFITLAATWKVIVTYLQTLLMMRWLQKNNPLLPTSFSTLIGGVQAIFSTSTSFFAQECAISGNYIVDKRVLMVTVAATFPLMVYVVIGLYYLLLPMFHRVSAWLKGMVSSTSTGYASTPFMWIDYATKMITSAVVVLFYYYPMWVQVFLEIFLCYTINLEDSADETDFARVSGLHLGPRWSYNFDLECYEGQHAVLVYTLGIAGIIFIVMAPLVMAWCLFANAYQLDIPHFRMKFGFLYEEYHSSGYLVTADHVPPGYEVLKILLTSISIITIAIFVICMINLWCDGMLLMVGLDPEEAMDLPRKHVLKIMLPEYKRKFKFMGRPLAILFLHVGRFQMEVKKAVKRLGLWTKKVSHPH
eukprot:gene1557-32939_t